MLQFEALLFAGFSVLLKILLSCSRFCAIFQMGLSDRNGLVNVDLNLGPSAQIGFGGFIR
jgi:hypothetical protein